MKKSTTTASTTTTTASTTTTVSVAWDKARELLRHVVRMFYEAKHAVLLDYVMYAQAIADDTLTERMHCQLKDVHRLMAALRDDKLVRTEAQMELRATGGGSSDASKTFTRTYLYMDYRLAVRAIRWRLEKVREASEQRLRADLEKKGYKCAQCGKRWSPLDVHALGFTADGFICDNCNVSLDFDEEDDGDRTPAPTLSSHVPMKTTRNPQELHVQLMECIAPLVQLLKQIRVDDLPVAKAAELIKRIHEPANLSALEQPAGGSSLPLPERLDIGVVVELPGDGDGDDEQHRGANSLPVWHTHSTVTGEKVSGAKGGSIQESDSTAEPTAKRHKSSDIEIVLDGDDTGAEDDVHDNANDPVVVVRGVSKAFSQVTDDDKRMMTSDEYEVYFDHFLRIQGQ